MSRHSADDSLRWEELQVTRLLFGLAADEQAEFDDLARRLPADEIHPFETVVASLDVAWSEIPTEPLPDHLRRAIRERAAQARAPQSVALPAQPPRNGSMTNRVGSYLPWFVSAACLLLALFSWISNRQPEQARPDIAQLRTDLIAANEGLVQVNWSAGPTPSGEATGDVVWSAPRQQGFMRFRGLPINNPSQEQYQLWIFDKNQSEATPIDGGVFDIDSTGEVIIPIHAKLRVREPFMFAITIEKPGGVVVSSRERLPLLAKVE